jgi:glucokinase
MNQQMNSAKVIGIDIGGSHITAAVVDLKQRIVLPETLIRKRINSHTSADDIISEWSETISQVFNSDDSVSKKLGIAMPGPFDYENGICLIKGLDKYESLYGLNVKHLLSHRLEIAATDILMMNDASCFLQGEVFSGAAINCNHVIGITLGTGLGSVRFHNNKIYDGDLYYTPFKDGTAEDYLSSRWFVKRYKKLTGNTVNDVKELRKRIYNDPTAQIVFDEFGINLGEVLADYITTHKAETVVVGGNIMNAWDLFISKTKQILYALPHPIHITRAKLGEEGALIGAASLWK